MCSEIATLSAALARRAEAAGVGLGYKAAVAGGIPVIKTLREGFRRARDVLLQSPLDRFRGRGQRPTRFHLYCNEHRATARDNVDFTGPAAVTAGDNVVTLGAQ